MNSKTTLAFVATFFVCCRLAVAAMPSTKLRKGPNEISDVIRSKMGELNSCYIDKANTSYDPGGKVTLAITTSGSGHVSGMKLVNYSLTQPGKKPFLKCISHKIRTWKFPVTGAYSRTFVQSFYFG